jgi:anaerobic magnesium-protoporphyrin IX monomethyl ester cyclase
MRIALVMPAESDIAGGFLNFQVTYVPLGIAQIAAVLEQKGHEVLVIDMRLLRDSQAKTSRLLEKFSPGLVGITTSFFSSKQVMDLARRIRNETNAKIVLGGPYATVNFKELLMQSDADAIVLDEGEESIAELADLYEKGADISQVKGVALRRDGKIVKNALRPVNDDLDSLPFPAFHLFDLKKYRANPKHYKRLPILPMITGRGCIYGRCDFCYQPRRYGKRQSPSRVVEEIKHFQMLYGIKEIRFWDDVFLYDRKWVFEFCDLLDKERLDITWGCNGRVDLADKEMLQRASRSGCWQVLYGIESANLNLLRSVHKGTTLRQAVDAVRWTKEAGMEVRISCILGLPEETPDLTDQTISFAYSLDPDVLQFSLFTPYPGTRSYDDLKGSKRLESDISKYSELYPVLLPKGYHDRKELMNKFRRAYSGFYMAPSYLIGRLLKIRGGGDIKRYFEGLLMALQRSE